MATVEDLLRLPPQKLRFLADNVDPNDEGYPLIEKALEELDKRRSGKLSSDIAAGTTPPKSKWQMAKESLGETVTQDLGPSGLAETARTIGGASARAGDVLLRQGAGTAAAAIQAVPGVAPAFEAAGDLAQTLVPSQRERIRSVLPTPGYFESVVEQSPSPLASRVAGWSAAPLGAAGRLGATVKGVAEPLVKPVVQLSNALRAATSRAGPGVSTMISGASTPALMAAGEAAIRRMPGASADLYRATTGRDISLPESYAPLSLRREILPAAALGSLASVVPAAAASASNPASQGGRIAARYAAERKAGTYEPEEFQRLDTGRKGVSQAWQEAQPAVDEARDLAKTSVADAMEQAKFESGRALSLRKADIQAGVEEASNAAKVRMAEAASTVEPRMRSKLGEQRMTAKKAFERDMATLEKFLVDENGRPMKFDTEPLFQRIRNIVAESARQDTENTPGEIRLPLGEQQANVESMLRRYLGGPKTKAEQNVILDARGNPIASGQSQAENTATIRDFRRAIQELGTLANSGTPEKRYPYQKIVRSIRDYLIEVDPTQTLGDIYQKYRTSATQRERLNQMVYREESEKLGTGGVRDRFDDPDIEAPTPDVTPGEELRGRKFLVSSTDPSGEMGVSRPQYEEVRQAGFDPELEEMSSARRSSDYDAQRAKRIADEEIAREELNQQQQLRGTKERATRQAEIPIGVAKRAQEKITSAKHAYEESRWPGPMKLAPGLIMGGAGMTYPGQHGLVLTLLGATSTANELAQPLRSRAAYYLPSAEQLRMGLPLLVGPELAGGRLGNPVVPMVDFLREKERYREEQAERIWKR